MTDKSLEALHDEMRACKYDQGLNDEKRIHLLDQQEVNNAEQCKLLRRQKILDETLRLHIHDRLPVLQAKMVATENIEAADAIAKANTSHIYGATISANSINVSSIKSWQHGPAIAATAPVKKPKKARAKKVKP